jgi:hypothetical protein
MVSKADLTKAGQKAGKKAKQSSDAKLAKKLKVSGKGNKAQKSIEAFAKQLGKEMGAEDAEIAAAEVEASQ